MDPTSTSCIRHISWPSSGSLFTAGASRDVMAASTASPPSSPSEPQCSGLPDSKEDWLPLASGPVLLRSDRSWRCSSPSGQQSNGVFLSSSTARRTAAPSHLQKRVKTRQDKTRRIRTKVLISLGVKEQWHKTLAKKKQRNTKQKEERRSGRIPGMCTTT